MQFSIKTKWILFFYLVALAFLSLNPWILPNPDGAMEWIEWDLIDHSAAYIALSIIMMCTFKLKNRALNVSILVIFTSSLIGAAFEIGQYLFTSYRQFSLSDACANVFGSVLGVLIFWIIYLIRSRLMH